MKKNFFLTLMLAVLCTAASWAQFAPVSGTKYALKEVTSGLFLDIQTLGINEPNANGTTNNISLSAKPCVIYFGASNGKYTMKNVNGTYAQQASSRNWNAVIGSDAYLWTILDSDSDGYYTIARADGKFVKMDNPTNGAPLFCDKDTGLEFALVEYSNIIPGVYTVKTATGTYLTQKEHTLGTKATFQETAENFKIMPSGNLFYFENNDVAGQYLGTTHQWNATFDFSMLQIVDIDVDGFATIVRANAPNLQIGSDDNTNAGTGIFTNINKDDEKISNKWYFEGTYDYPTVGTVNNNKYHFTSDYITYAGACNKIRFTLTASGAYYKNGVKRLSFDSFELYDADGKKVELAAVNVTGNNIVDFTNMLDGANDTYSSCAWDTPSATDDWFEILLPTGVDLGGAFKFSFVTENTTMNAKKFTINTSYEKPADYTVVINAPQGEAVTVKYNDEVMNADDKVAAAGFDKSLVDATNISGYTWSVVVDDENKTVTIQYTAIEVVENPAAVVALIKRVGGESAAEQFKFVLDPSINSKNEVFVIGGEDGKVLIKGTTISAITTGIGWYLNNYAHINIAWNSLNEKTVSGDKYADLSNIPVPTSEETRTSDAMYRYYLNTCTFGYSMTSWTWKRWQQEIDWMALHGINMPLQLVGMEEVWRKFLTMEEGGKRKYGYTDAEAKAFVAGPAFIAWWAMNNLEGWGGTAPGSKSGYNNLAGAGGVQDDAWYARQKALAKQITDRQRELGMQPVLPGWSGMVPTNFASKSGYATRGNGDNWAGDFVRPLLLSVGNANYAEIAADYYTCLHEVMGESKYYSMDPFHEGGGAGTMEDYEALYAAMETAKPGSQWVIQQWQWSATQKYSLTAVPAGRLIVLDLFSDGSPAFDGYNGYAPQDAVFCAIPNFGGRSGLMGRLNNLADNYFKFKGKYASIKGIGAAPEAIEQTPVTYDLIFQLPWMGTKPDVAEWVANYSIARYGVENADVQAAWELLRQGVLNYGADGIQGPVEDVWAARPNLTANKASSWGKTLANAMGTYTKERQLMLIDATYKLLAQNAAITGEVYRSNYLYDIVEFGGGVMADYAYYLLLGIKEARDASNTELYVARRDAFLQIIRDMDTFRGTNLNFRLGKWTQEARAAAQEAIALGATAANADWYEYNNARTILTTWSSPGTNLTDYSYRSWQGLLKDFYLPRWEAYFAADCGSLEYKFFEWNWAHGMTHAVGQTGISSTPLTAGQVGHTDSYTREPVGNTIDEANKMLGKYIIPLKTDNGTTYAYRYLTNTLSAEYKVEAAEGGTIDLSKFFLANIDVATVTGDFINGTVNDIKDVPVKSGIAGNTYDAVMTLTDGTVVNFKVVVNSAAMVTAKEELAALIEKMETLTAQVGSYNPVGTVTDVTERLTTEGTAGTAEFYVWTNAQEDAEGPIENLVDGNTETHFHSEYSTNVGANHFINVDLGANNKMSSFRFIYSTRKAETNFPKTIEVSGCNERTGTYEYITTVTNLPAGNSNSVVTYVSDRISCAKEYAYLRFTVTANNSGKEEAGGHPYFHMSEFGLEEVCATADVIDVYDGTELTDAFAAEKYDVLLAAINVYKNATTAAEINAATTKLQAAYDELSAKVEAQQPQEPAGFNGVYHINYNGNPIFPAYAAAGETAESWMDSDGYHLFNSGADEVPAAAQADVLFTIEPNNSGYTLSAQGLYMHSTPDALQTWHPMILSNDKNNAGVFLFEETAEQDLYKLKSDKDDSFVNYVNCWGKIFGNDLKADAVSTFTFEKVTEYTLTVPANGATTLCLPFNVVLPAGVTAYDLAKANITKGNYYSTYELVTVATAGETIAANTPVIIKATAGDHILTITMDGEGAKASVENSVLRSGIVKTTLGEGNNYTFDGEDFNLVAAGTEIAANQCWMELDENLGAKVYGTAPDYVLTTDEENPVLYKIQVNRNFNNLTATVLRYNESTGVVNIVASADDNSYQAWYFMEGDNGGILIKPYNGDGKVLGADDNNDGGTKVWAVEKDSKTIDEWTFEKNGEWYNILGDGKCFSNHGGNNSGTMGFYNDKNDGGSQFKFVEAEFTDDNARYYQLKDVAETMEAATYYSGTSVGLYSTESVNAYNAIFTTADGLVAAGSNASASADCYAAYKALRTADEVLVYNAPAADKVYYIVSTAADSYCTGKYVRTYSEPHLHQNATWGDKNYDQRHLLFDDKADISQLSLAAFQFEETGTKGEYKMKNLHTGLYVKSFNKDVEHMGTAADAAIVKIAGIADGQVTLKIGSDKPMHAQNDYSVIVTWDASANNASTWSINEVADMSELYTLAVPESGVTTLNLAFNVVLPEGVEAYDVVEDDFETEDGNYKYNLTSLATAGSVLAKNTPVVIKATKGSYTLNITMDDNGAIPSTAGSALRGNYWERDLAADANNYQLVVAENAVVFKRVDAATTAAANTAWMVLSDDKGGLIYDEFPEAPAAPIELTDGGVYRIKGLLQDGTTYRTVYTNGAGNKLRWTSAEKNDATTLFVVQATGDGKFKLVSALANGLWNDVCVLDEDGVELTLLAGKVAGTYAIRGNGYRNFAADGEGTEGEMNYFSSDGSNVHVTNTTTTDFVFEEVTDDEELAKVAYAKLMPKDNNYATLFLPYRATVPDGVTAYTATIENKDQEQQGFISLVEIPYGIIPARTAVVLHREIDANDETFSFVYAQEYADAAQIVGNLFGGRVTTGYVGSEPGQDNDKYYLLLNLADKRGEALYKMYREYSQNGDHNGTAGTNNGGYIKCEANKGYMKLSGSAASSYSFRFEGSTGIDEVEGESGEVKAIYDLQGRKLTEITKPGFYIVDGAKVFVK